MYHKIQEFYPQQRPKTSPKGESKAWSPDSQSWGRVSSQCIEEFSLCSQNHLTGTQQHWEGSLGKKMSPGSARIVSMATMDVEGHRVKSAAIAGDGGTAQLLTWHWQPSPFGQTRLATFLSHKINSRLPICYLSRNYETETILSQWNYGYLNHSKTCSLTYPLCIYHL